MDGPIDFRKAVACSPSEYQDVPGAVGAGRLPTDERRAPSRPFLSRWPKKLETTKRGHVVILDPLWSEWWYLDAIVQGTYYTGNAMTQFALLPISASHSCPEMASPCAWHAGGDSGVIGVVGPMRARHFGRLARVFRCLRYCSTTHSIAGRERQRSISAARASGRVIP